MCPCPNPESFSKFCFAKILFSRGAVVISKVGGVPCLWQLTNLLLVPALQIWPTPEQGKKSLENFAHKVCCGKANLSQLLIVDHDQGKRKLTHCPVSPDEKMFNIYILKEVSVIAFSSGARRGGARLKIRGAGRRWKSAGRGKKARKSTDPKNRQQCVNCYWDICSALWCFDKGNIISFHFKNVFLWTR